MKFRVILKSPKYGDKEILFLALYDPSFLPIYYVKILIVTILSITFTGRHCFNFFDIVSTEFQQKLGMSN